MPLFNLQSYCEERNLKPTLVRTWLILNLRKYSFDQKIELNEKDMQNVLLELTKGAKSDFDISTIEEPNKALRFLEYLLKKSDAITQMENLKFKIRVFKEAVIGIKEQLQSLDEEIIQAQTSKTENKRNRLNQLSLSKSSLLMELETKNNKLQELIEVDNQERRARFNSKFYSVARERLLSKFPDLLSSAHRNLSMKDDSQGFSEKSNKKKEIIRDHFPTDGTDLSVSTDVSKIALISWENIIFGEGFIFLKHEGRFFQRIPLHQCRRSFNAIKELYRNRKLAPLEIHYVGNRITKIVNIELLTFLFIFFDHSGTDFKTKDLRKLLQSSQSYSKSFYKKYFKDFFAPRCFAYLIEKADEYSPIVPLPERVINSSGIDVIHDAFLFPIRKMSRYYWVLESIEEKKATYIFETSLDDYIEELQLLYDFLSGGFTNKRLALSRRVVNSQQLKIIKRIKHSDFSKWKNTIDVLIQLDV